MEFRVGFIELDKFYGDFLRWDAAFGQKDSAVFRAAKITAKQEPGIDNSPFPLFPRFGHSAPPRPFKLSTIVLSWRRR